MPIACLLEAASDDGIHRPEEVRPGRPDQVFSRLLDLLSFILDPLHFVYQMHLRQAPGPTRQRLVEALLAVVKLIACMLLKDQDASRVEEPERGVVDLEMVGRSKRFQVRLLLIHHTFWALAGPLGPGKG